MAELWRRGRGGLLDVLLLPATPHEIALGVAIGAFVSMTPTPGLQMALAGALAAAVRGSVRAALPMVWLSNPLTAAPLMYLSYEIGRPFCAGAPRLTAAELAGAAAEASGSLSALLRLGEQLLLPWAIGGTLLGLGLAVVAYPATTLMVRWRRG